MSKKLISFILVLISLFIIFIYFYNKENNYVAEYWLEDFYILESYNKDNKLYTFNINDDQYEFKISGEYTNKRELVDSIKEYNNQEGYSCLELKGKLEFYNICYNEDNEYIFDNNVIIDKKIEEYNNIDIYNTIDKTFLIWNYNKFSYINEKFQTIELFEKDVYNPSKFIVLDKYLFIPDYENNYSFNKYYLIDFKTGDIEEKTLKTDINLDIEYTNYDNETLSIYDDKINKEYDLDINKNTLKTKNNVEYSSKDLEEISFNEYNYFYLDNNKLIYEIDELNILITILDVDKIIYQNKTEVIFLVDSKLYYFDIYTSEIILLLENKEWEFNNNNLIYIY